MPIFAVFVLLLGSATGCAQRPPIDTTALAIAAERIEPKRMQGMAQQATIRAAAAGIGYEPSPEQMDEVARQLFSSLDIAAVPCWAEFTETAAYCGVYPEWPKSTRSYLASIARKIDSVED